MRTRYKIINNAKDLNRLISAIKSVKRVSVDFETNGQPIYNQAFLPTVLSITYQPGSAIILPLAHQDSPLRGSWLSVLRKFGRQIIENPEITKMGWNWKFDNQIFAKYGIITRGVVIDGMLAKYLLNEEKPNGLKEMVERYLPEHAGYEDEGDFKKYPWDNKPFEPLCQYAAIDTDMTFRLCTFFEKKLIDLKLYKVYRNLIMPASTVLQSVEQRGLFFDSELNKQLEVKYAKLIEEQYALIVNIPRVKRYIKFKQRENIQNYINTLQEEIKQLKKSNGAARSIDSREKKIIQIIGGNFTTKKEKQLIEPFNLGSTKQLIDLLFVHRKGLKYPILEFTKDKFKKPTQTPSTAEDTLLKLLEYDKFDFINQLLVLRGYNHTNSTFIKGYQEVIQDDGKIHPKFLIHGTVTGRLSSREPNAQQIPKKEVNPDIKPQFIAPPGYLFLSYDYSQAELRIMAHLAGEKDLLKAFQLGRDVHLTIACKKYGFNYDDILPIYLDETHAEYKIWKVRRKQAKQVVFGCIYGIESKKLSQQLSDLKMGIIVSPAEAQQFLDDFFIDYPKVKTFMDRQKRKMERNGYVKTLFGRKRRCPKIYSENYGEFLEAARQSVNAPCQSAASDMALFASILIHWKIKQGHLPPIPEVSTVHDSIYNYIKPEFINPWTIYQLYSICKNPNTKKYFNFRITDVDMAMDFSVGRNMMEEYPYCPGYDYANMVKSDFSIEEYYSIHSQTKHIPVSDYPEKFPQYFTKKFKKTFMDRWQKIHNIEDNVYENNQIN